MAQGDALTIGSEVLTFDGERIGYVKAVRGDYFKVETTTEPDYWLGVRDITEVRPEHVRLSFIAQSVNDHKQDEPAGIEI